MAWKPAQIPYLKGEDALPTPLPTDKAILESTVVFRDDDSHHRVIAVEPHFIIKHGRGVDEIEGQVLLFLEHHLPPGTGVPKLYAMYRMQGTNHICLIMQRMPGETLEKLWFGLNKSEKSEICTQLKHIFTLIRHIPAPPLYGSIDNGPYRNYLFYAANEDREICGPFESEENFNAALIKRLRVAWAGMHRHSFKADFYERNLHRTLSGHGPIFSHSDLQRKNVMVHRDSSKGFKVSLVDWEEAGWFPTYWDYFIALQGVRWDDDWAQRIEEVLEPWLGETAVMRMVHQDVLF